MVSENNGKEIELNNFELQYFSSSRSLRRRLQDFENQQVVVEFCCDGFMKKAMGCLKDVGCDYIELTSPVQGPVRIDVFCCRQGSSAPFMTEYASVVLIPMDRICAVEISPPCPPCPEEADEE
ncbi:MAG: hypothetical protein ACOCZ3_03395 [Bacillota bacterium]